MKRNSLTSSAFQDEVPNYFAGTSNVSSIGRFGRKARVAQPTSPWFEELEDRLNELTALPRGWNGYDGAPVSFTCAQFAAALIERLFCANVPAPQLVPGDDGTLQLEWHINGFDVELDVLAPYEVNASRFDHLTGEDEEIEVQADFTALTEWMSQLGEERGPQLQTGT
ncbi:hypothetical protein [Sulfitobacter sp. D7]|uniref:hypothetical protein n=1 Tax=Sulfitobacter sp. D7 TaxID=1968541 RepID=UPI000E77F23D|nr:hypothetical protein [Sulfitobacter sp. D7]AYE84849.1 hypothetical protein B5M07_01235 [Sulfitobacter sp. D7]